MKVEFFQFWTRETISNIRRNQLMSILAVSTAMVGLFILGMFFLMLSNLHAVVRSETQKLDLVAILQSNITPQRRKQIYEATRIPQVADLQFIAKSQVLREMQKDMPDLYAADIQDYLGDELRVKLKDPQDIFKVRAYLQSIKGVQVVRLDDEPVRNLLAISRFLTVAGVIALLVLGLAILLIIHNAIRLTIFARRREIRIMELVGATSWFIRVPFLVEGIIYGLTGAVVAAALLGPLYATLTRMNTPLVRLLLPLSGMDVLWSCLGWMLIAGLGFGLIGSWISLSRSIGKTSHI